MNKKISKRPSKAARIGTAKSDSKTKDIPVIFLAALNEVSDETKGFELGAVDFINKPVSPCVQLSRVRTYLTPSTIYRKNYNWITS